MGATGRGIGSGFAVRTGVAPAFPPAAGLSTASATRTLLARRSCRAAAHSPLKPSEVDSRRRSAIPGAHPCRASLARRRFAAQPVRREPSRRQTGKPAYSCLAESQKPKQNGPAFPPRQAVDARFRRKSDTVNNRCFANASPDKQRRQSVVTTLCRRHGPLAATQPPPARRRVPEESCPLPCPLRQVKRLNAVS